MMLPNTDKASHAQTGFAAGPPQGKTRPHVPAKRRTGLRKGAGSDTKRTTVGAMFRRRAAPRRNAPPRGARSHTQWASVGAIL